MFLLILKNREYTYCYLVKLLLASENYHGESIWPNIFLANVTILHPLKNTIKPSVLRILRRGYKMRTLTRNGIVVVNQRVSDLEWVTTINLGVECFNWKFSFITHGSVKIELTVPPPLGINIWRKFHHNFPLAY